jgi:hypothetical protein
MTQFPLSQSFSLLPSKFIKMNDLIIQIFSWKWQKRIVSSENI